MSWSLGSCQLIGSAVRPTTCYCGGVDLSASRGGVTEELPRQPAGHGPADDPWHDRGEGAWDKPLMGSGTKRGRGGPWYEKREKRALMSARELAAELASEKAAEVQPILWQFRTHQRAGYCCFVATRHLAPGCWHWFGALLAWLRPNAFDVTASVRRRFYMHLGVSVGFGGDGIIASSLSIIDPDRLRHDLRKGTVCVCLLRAPLLRRMCSHGSGQIAGAIARGSPTGASDPTRDNKQNGDSVPSPSRLRRR